MSNKITMEKSAFIHLRIKEQNKIKAMKADHVSKSELRAWCEQEENHHKYYDDYYQRDVEVVYLKEILDKFCSGEK